MLYVRKRFSKNKQFCFVPLEVLKGKWKNNLKMKKKASHSPPYSEGKNKVHQDIIKQFLTSKSHIFLIKKYRSSCS